MAKPEAGPVSQGPRASRVLGAMAVGLLPDGSWSASSLPYRGSWLAGPASMWR